MPQLDASSPAHVITAINSGATADSGTTAAFSPPADSWLFLDVGANEAAGNSITFNLPTNTGTALSWALIGSTTNASGGGCASYRAYNANAQVGITVSLTLNYVPGVGGGPANSSGMDVEVWTGCAKDQTGAAKTSSTGTAKTNNPSLNTTRAGSRVRLVGLDWTAGGNPTSSDTIKPYTVATQTSGGIAYKSADSGAPGAVTVNFVDAGASGTNSFLIYEILAPLAGGAVVLPRVRPSLPGSPSYAAWIARPQPVFSAVALTAYVLPADTGAYAFTGNAANLLRGYEVVGATGAYNYTGIAAALERGLVLAAVRGVYTYTGIAAAFEKGNVLAAATGAYAFTGKAANLLKGSDLVAVRGIYAYTGVAAAFPRTYVLGADRGAYSYVGLDATLIYSGAGPSANGGHTRRRRGR